MLRLMKANECVSTIVYQLCILGRQYDKNGRRRMWWTQEAVQAFNERAQCFVEQYSNFEMYGIPVSICETCKNNSNTPKETLRLTTHPQYRVMLHLYLGLFESSTNCKELAIIIQYMHTLSNM